MSTNRLVYRDEDIPQLVAILRAGVTALADTLGDDAANHWLEQASELDRYHAKDTLRDERDRH